jgi:SAM-dependent methyltransferase
MPIVPNNATDILWGQLRELPAFRALIRAMEARLFARLGPLPSPLLDLGCGDGHFGQSVFDRLDIGIDLDLNALREAQRHNTYGLLNGASAIALPFANNTFASIVSNCVIEHIPNNEAVMREVARALRPGGNFVFSVPTDRLNPSMFTPTLLNALGAHGLARKYMDWFTRVQVHYHLYNADEWQRRAESAGFRIIQRIGYLSPRAAKLFELGHYYGIPNLLAHKLTNRWVLWPWRPRFALEEAILRPIVMEDNPPDATCYFFVAIKKYEQD